MKRFIAVTSLFLCTLTSSRVFADAMTGAEHNQRDEYDTRYQQQTQEIERAYQQRREEIENYPAPQAAKDWANSNNDGMRAIEEYERDMGME